MPQPHFADILENPALPYYQRKQLEDPSPEKPKVSSAQAQAQAQPGETSQTIVTTASPAKDTVSVSSSSQPGAPAHKTLTVSINLGPLGVAQDSCKPARKKRRVVKDPIGEDNPIDDEDKDITYVPDEEPEEPEEQENVPSSQPSSQSSQPSGKTHLEHVTPSLTSGIPQLPQKRKAAKEENKKYECKACPKKFQRTSELRDHNFTVHLKMTYDCAECLKCYQTKKALAHHNKTVHSGIGAVKCTQENCQWQSKEVGSLHQHLLEVHGIGKPIVCNVVTPSGQKCGKVFKNTRSFQAHASFHMQRQFKCELCDHYFATQEQIKTHVRKYHKEAETGEKYQCDICGQILDNELILHNHRMLHKLAHHKELQEQAQRQKATKSSRGSAPPTQETATPVQPLLAPEKLSSSSSQQPGASTAQSDLLLIGHAVVQPKDDPDLEATLEQIQEEEEAEQEVKEQQQ